MAVLELTSIRVDEERARAYVLAHGGSREKARLEGIFGATGPAREVVKTLEGLQNPDGGFPLFQVPGNPSSVDTTCYLLQQMKEMPPLEGSPMASRAVSFLRRVQQNDGSWAESPQAAALGAPWQTGNARSRAYLTALATYTILTLEPDHLDPVSRGISWLRRSLVQEPGGGESYPHTFMLAWAAWYRFAGKKSPEVVWAFQHLQQREMDAPELAWFLSVAHEIGAGGRYLLPLAQLLARLGAMQGEDGAWPAEEGFAMESTLTALRVFRGYGVI